MSNSDLDILPGAVSLRPPQEILAEATERANVLAQMVEKSKSYVKIGQGKHLRVEAWITLAGFYGCSARIIATEEVEYGGVFGFKARARVTHDATGNIIAEADAICMHDEANWAGKPLHQVLSMAETRATSKALAMKFRSVVVLSGFNPTPAEEVDEQGKKTKAAAEKLPPAPVLPFGKSKGKKINDPTVPDEDLRHMIRAKEDRLKKTDRDSKWDEADMAMIDAIETELEERANRAAAHVPHLDQPAVVDKLEAEERLKRKPLNDSAWRDLIIVWEDEHRNSLEQAKEEWGAGDIDALPPAERWRFADTVQKYIDAAKAR